jgi:hypothetical protein
MAGGFFFGLCPKRRKECPVKTEIKDALILTKELISEDVNEQNEPTYDPSVKEDILFQIDRDENSVMPFILSVTGSEKEMGLVSHEYDYGCLDYMIGEMLDTALNGYYVATEGTMTYYRGDGWEIDDDAVLDVTEIRPARWHEIREAESFWVTLKAMPQQLKIQWRYSRGWPV